jgi:hypothetical protein
MQNAILFYLFIYLFGVVRFPGCLSLLVKFHIEVKNFLSLFLQNLNSEDEKKRGK